jgi:hypothetical protein
VYKTFKAFTVIIFKNVLNSTRRIQATKAECEKFKYNIAHGLKGTGMNTKSIE